MQTSQTDFLNGASAHDNGFRSDIDSSFNIAALEKNMRTHPSDAVQQALRDIHGIKQEEEYIVLYKYMSFQAFEATMASWALKATIPHEANDPFECYPQYIGNKRKGPTSGATDDELAIRSASLESSRKEKTREWTFISLSRSMTSSIMWGHYADACKGVCLAFYLPVHRCVADNGDHYNVEEYKLFEVKYAHERVASGTGKTEGTQTAIELITRKDKNWEYEREYRLIGQLEDATYISNGIVGFHSIMKYLAGIIVGHRCRQGKGYVQQLLKLSMKRAAGAGHTFRWIKDETNVYTSAPAPANFSVESPGWTARCVDWWKKHPHYTFAFKTDKLKEITLKLPLYPITPKGVPLMDIIEIEMGLRDFDERFCKQAAQGGLGENYKRYSDNEKIDYYTILSCLSAAEKGDDPFFQFRVGLYYECAEQMHNAARWYQKAADRHCPHAWTKLARFYEKGVIKADTNRKPADLYRLAAEKGDSLAQAGLAHCYQKGTGVGADVAKAIELYTKAAAKGDLASITALAECYEADSPLQDPDKAMKLCKEAAGKGHARAQWMLAKRCETGESGVDQDPEAAAKWYRLAAAQGHIVACMSLARMYECGLVADQDGKARAYWYRMAAEQESAEYQNKDSKGYRLSDSEDLDCKRYVENFKKSASYGDPYAMLQLGMIYLNGRGVKKMKRRPFPA